MPRNVVFVAPFPLETTMRFVRAVAKLDDVRLLGVVHDAPQGYEGNAPYTVAIVKLAEGPMVTALLTDVDNNQVGIGMPVEMVTRKLNEQDEEGVIVYGYKFRPQLQRQAVAA